MKVSGAEAAGGGGGRWSRSLYLHVLLVYQGTSTPSGMKSTSPAATLCRRTTGAPAALRRGSWPPNIRLRRRSHRSLGFEKCSGLRRRVYGMK